VITSLPTKLISAISQRETFIRVLPTRRRRKPAGIEITSRISIQTAGLAFGRHRVKGVDGSCAKRLTVESYTVVMLLTVILIIIISFPSINHSFIPGLRPSFSANPSHRSLSFSSSSGLTTWILQIFTVTSEHSRFYFFVFFLFYTF